MKAEHRCHSRPLMVGGLVVSAFLALLGLAPAADAATGSYGYTTWSQPLVNFTNFLDNGPVLAPPASLPTGSTLTTLTGTLNMTPQPSGSYYAAWWCEGTGTSACVNISPSGIFYGSWSWNYAADITAANIPASQPWHLVLEITDGSGVVKVLNPARYLTAAGRNAVFNYKY